MRLPRNKTGAIEGMPLHLLIVVIVAGLTLAAMLGWVLSIQGPSVIKSVSTNPTTIHVGPIPADQTATKTIPTISVTAYDAKDAPIPGIAVTIRGPVSGNLVALDGTDADGTVTFSNVRVTLPPGTSVGELTLTIQKAGYPSKTWTIPIVRAQ